MSNVTYHLRRAGGVNVVVRQHRGIEKPLRRCSCMVGLIDAWDWGNSGHGTMRLALDLLADAIRYKHLAALASVAFTEGVLSHLDGNCVLDRDAVRDWFYRSVRFTPAPATVDGEDAQDGTLIF